MPANTVVVSRPSRWGNPYHVSDVVLRYPSLTAHEAAAFAVNQFRHDLRADHPGYPSDDDIRRELAGRNLACWCPLARPCHADVLLEIAHGELSRPNPPTKEQRS